jgi:hypothetical protein
MVDPQGHGDVKQVLNPLSPGYRSQCQPRPGAASRKCQAGTGATVESIYRTHTNPLQILWHRIGIAISREASKNLRKSCRPGSRETCSDLGFHVSS